MIVVGIDPGWRNLSVHIAEVSQGMWTWLYWENIDLLPQRKTYSFQAIKKALLSWYTPLAFLFDQAEVIVIERQPYRRMRNVSEAIAAVIENKNNLFLDIKSMKKYYEISTGKHYTNKKAVIDKFAYILPKVSTFRNNHNLIDSWLVVHYYVTVCMKIDIKSNQ